DPSRGRVPTATAHATHPLRVTLRVSPRGHYGSIVQLELRRAVLDKLDVPAALGDEISRPPMLLPSRLLENALAGADEAIAEVFTGQFEQGIDVSVVQVVAMPKARRGLRPIPTLSLRDRVLYRAAVGAFGEALPPPDRSDDAWEKFNWAPLDQSTA